MALDATYEIDGYNAYHDDDCTAAGPRRKPNRDRHGRDQRRERASQRPRDHRATSARHEPTRAARLGLEEFKCRRCHTFVGPTIGGGRHRNHCPRCLYSRHVDARRPGDRASECGALMAPVGRFDRADGEPVIVHRCGGCGVVRHNRLAADDDIVVLARLPLVQPWLGARRRGHGAARGIGSMGACRLESAAGRVPSRQAAPTPHRDGRLPLQSATMDVRYGLPLAVQE